MKRLLAFFITMALAAPASMAFAGERYALIRLEGTVNPIIAEHIVKSIAEANRQKVQFIVIQLDTPGGMMGSMRDIIKAMLSSEAPVVVYAYPKGAQAASAGGYIMLAAHIAAMAPGTEIGAMHPVSPLLNFGERDEKGRPRDGVMEKKVLNDTIAYARSLAQKRKRSVEWTERAVRDAVSSTYLEAHRMGIIDVIAEDMNDLLAKLHGRKVDVNGTIVVLNTRSLGLVPFELDWKQRILNFFADPQVVLLLFIIAVVGIGMEIKAPGLVVPGVVGAVALFIFLMAINILPVNFAGLALIVLAIVLFILELKIASYGLLTIGGILSFVAGAMILFDSPLPGGRIPLSSILGVVVFLLGFFFIVVRSVIKAHRGRVTTGLDGLMGETGIALRDFTVKGKVLIHGEIWNAESEEEIRKDDPVEIVNIRGMTLNVKKVSG